MTRPLLLAPALAIAALLWAVPPTMAAPVESAYTELSLPASNGMEAHLDTFNGEFTLEIRRGERYASYEVQGVSNSVGLKARFGQLGIIDVAFHPTEVEADKPPKGCKGPPSVMREGMFVGTISFTGEGGYVRIEETEVEGSLNLWRESEWRCPRHQGRSQPNRTRRPSAPLPRRGDTTKEPATLVARKPGCHCVFVAYGFPGEHESASSLMYGGTFESRKGMEITRVTGAETGASAFTYNHKAGTASIHPPHPIVGSGAFKRRPHAPDLWRSTLRVPLLGADPLDMRAGGFRATLVNELPEFR